MKTSYLINSATFALAASAGKDVVAVKTASDLEKFTNGQLANIYNSATGSNVSPFKTSKAASAAKVFAALAAVTGTGKTTPKAKATPKAGKTTPKAKATPKATSEKKVRDSKLQRVAAAFREIDKNGAPKQFTIADLMKKCGVTKNIAHQYISILRSPSDRFVMKIEKTKVEGADPVFSLKA